MEQLNRVELRGIVGSVRISEVGDTKIARLSVATSFAYRSEDGSCVIDTCWHLVQAFEGKNICPLESLGKGDKIEVTGRIRNRKYIREDGTEVVTSDILASRIMKLETQDPLQYQI